MPKKKAIQKAFLILLLMISVLCACTSKQSEPTASSAAATTAPATSADSTSEAAAAPTTSTDAPASSVPLSATVEEYTSPSTAVSVDSAQSDPNDIYDSTGFVSVSEVIPDVILEIRYYSTYNFIGDRINGYEEPVALLTKEAATALSGAADELREKGYRLKIFDAYRPQVAVEHFVSWASDLSDTRMKPYFYPEVDKSQLFNYGYIAQYSGHSRGCTLDLTLFDMNTGKEVDMGGPFDYFGTLSHPDYTGITDEQYQNRMLLREAMTNNGFRPCGTEWWDFTLINEPYPATYFSFPVKSLS